MVDMAPAATPVEMMIVAASRTIREKVKAQDYRTILAGIGASNLAAWKAYYDLRREGADLVAEVGFYGYTPRPSDPFIFNFRNFPTCTMVTDILTVLGSMVGAGSSRCIGVLSAGQVDRHGNINSTKVPEMNLYLVGSGGACDVALGAREVLVTVPLDRLRCVDEVGYITAPGGRVRTVVTDMGIFEKPAGGNTLELTAFYRSRHGDDARAAVEEARSRCGWGVGPAPSLRAVEPPTPDELIDVRIFDPGRYFLGS
jgi:acyl CoA:acetate/3-ketoacid CoA transferase beta subunit